MLDGGRRVSVVLVCGSTSGTMDMTSCELAWPWARGWIAGDRRQSWRCVPPVHQALVGDASVWVLPTGPDARLGVDGLPPLFLPWLSAS